MNLLSDIISNAMDLASAGQLDLKLDTATLYALNVVADMELELEHSARGRQMSVVAGSFTARSGTLPALPAYIRYRAGQNARWQYIDIVSDIEDLTRAENENRLAIMFFGSGNPYNYQLSFDPDASFNQAELWGAGSNLASAAADTNSLHVAASIPASYAHLAANRTALLLLDDALLLNPAAANLIAFVQSRANSLAIRQRDLQHRWTVYRSNADNSLADAVVRPYDPFVPEEYGNVFGG